MVLLCQGCALAQPDRGPCSSDPYELAAPLVGSWQEFSVDESGAETLAGERNSVMTAGGCALAQTFVSADDRLALTSFAYVDPEEQVWRERFVLSDGRTTEYRWQPGGDDIILHRVGSRDYRLRITDIAANRYRVIEETSSDNGVSWVPVSETVTRRIE